MYKLARQGGVINEQWRFAAGAAVQGAPALDAAGNLYFGTAAPTKPGGVYSLYSINNGGSQVWRNDSATYGALNSSFVYSSTTGLVYIGTGGGSVLALNAASGALSGSAFVATVGTAAMTSVGVDAARKRVYAGSADGYLYALPWVYEGPSSSPSASETTTPTGSQTPTSTPSLTSGIPPSGTSTASPTPSAGGTPPATTSGTPTQTVTATSSLTPSASMSRGISPSGSLNPSATPTSAVAGEWFPA